MIVRDDTKLITEEVDLDPGTVRVVAWPGDEQWAEFVGEQVGDGVSVLEELIGLDWPGSDDTEVIESNTPVHLRLRRLVRTGQRRSSRSATSSTRS